jgi:hypothetical protein
VAGHSHLRSVDVVIVVVVAEAIAIAMVEMTLTNEVAGVLLLNGRLIPVAGIGVRRRRHSAGQTGGESHDGHQFFSFHAFSPFETLSW